MLSPERNFVTAIGLTLTAVCLLAVSYYVNHYSSLKVIVTAIGKPPQGGVCGFYVYDRNGKAYPTIGQYVEYNGPAPLYEVPSFGSMSDGCPLFPDNILPSIATRGKTIYPLIISASTQDDWIGLGESTKLTVMAMISDKFEGDTFVTSIPLSNTQTLEVDFKLNTTNFEFKPDNGPSHLSTKLPAEYIFSISPREKSAGKQYIGVELAIKERPRDLRRADVYLETLSIWGLDPRLTAALPAIGGFIIGLFGIIKLIPELWGLYKKTFQSHRSKRNRPKRDR